jgi:hypothetical protein
MTAPERDKPSVAYRWLSASAVAAGLALLFLVLVINGHGEFVWPGYFAVTNLVWFAQHQFTETHRRYYHRWPAGWQLFWTGSPERHEVGQAWLRRDPINAVEGSRLLGIGLVGFAVLAGVAFFGLRSVT